MKIVVAMSGGVDSSVAAALLVREGHEVIGAFMKNWTDTKDVQGVCDWKNDKRDAQRVAAKLGIPLVVMDFQKEYRKGVVDYMFREYRAGRTPNPDVICNTTVKFGPFLAAAKKLGADKIATGHYATVIPDKCRVAARDPGSPNKTYHLLRARDENKDQTYFLHQLNQKQLAHTLFPIGNYTKPQVRALARKFGLPTAERVESMGVCFIGEINMKDFLKQKIKPKPGNIVTSAGEVIGEHEGLVYYTIGQRHGFVQRGGGKPLYVVAKDFKKNELVVGSENDPRLLTREISVGDVHWINSPLPLGEGDKKLPLLSKEGRGEVLVRFRHRQELQRCAIKKQEKNIIVVCSKPQRAITPGQFAVLYRGEECLGGGVIIG
ncbi:MAG: tRNA 2-thiouridine(34) synthase MnmA [Candidatus Magasanikbacteria bacterium]|nr:tRNA 2-thiouridine(34) synthase MnmA [Candidatus Magasanikbacteria bacterium]